MREKEKYMALQSLGEKITTREAIKEIQKP
jgi:hypothetical protein